MKVMCLVLIVFVAATQSRSLQERSALSQVRHFLHSAVTAAGSGCQKVTKYVTGPVCTAMHAVPKSLALESCTVFTVGAEICAGIVEGVTLYCSTFGAHLPGGPAADKIICDAIHRHG